MAVLEFKRPEKIEEHLTGLARCAVCKHEHIAVAPSGVDWMECPNCGLQKSRYVYDTVPDEDVYVCECGCDVFRITASNDTFCIHCGFRVVLG